ncbi:hypothetical protein [Halostella litorea]|uniref:hypothetical protein n=1 Tax=Halostella litorea TaxID=2528831 RepID=UPI001091C345|nr:hypothetical protein [Halostella litorea]
MHIPDNDHETSYNPAESIADVYSELNATDGAHHDLVGEQVDVTRHAEQRFLERVNGSEPYPRSRIKREFRESERIQLQDPSIVDPTRIHPDSGVVYVFDPDDRTVLTCFIPTESQLGNEALATGRTVA